MYFKSCLHAGCFILCHVSLICWVFTGLNPYITNINSGGSGSSYVIGLYNICHYTPSYTKASG